MSQKLFSSVEIDVAREATLSAGAWQIASDLGPWLQYASGKSANNRLVMDIPISDDEPSDVQSALLKPFTKLVELTKADVLWGVPPEGQPYATKLGELLDMPVVKLVRYENKVASKAYRFAKPEDRLLANQAERLVGFEGAGVEMTALYGALRRSPQLRRLARATVAIGMGWRRGWHRYEHPLPTQVFPLITDQIPYMISAKKRFYKAHGEYARKVNRK